MNPDFKLLNQKHVSYLTTKVRRRSYQRGTALLEILIGLVLVFGAIGIVGLQTISFQKNTPHLTNQIRLNQVSEEIAQQLAARKITSPQTGWALISPSHVQIVTRRPTQIEANVVVVEYSANYRMFLDGLVEVVVYLDVNNKQSTMGVAHYRKT